MHNYFLVAFAILFYFAMLFIYTWYIVPKTAAQMQKNLLSMFDADDIN